MERLSAVTVKVIKEGGKGRLMVRASDGYLVNQVPLTEGGIDQMRVAARELRGSDEKIAYGEIDLDRLNQFRALRSRTLSRSENE